MANYLLRKWSGINSILKWQFRLEVINKNHLSRLTDFGCESVVGGGGGVC